MLSERISHYQIVEQIGVGGMGVVYKAIDVDLDRPVALKVLPDSLAKDTAAIERLRREARAASALNEPGICTIYEIGQADGIVFIAMELLEGETVSQRLKRGRLTTAEVLDMALQVVSALEHAHGRGVMHRDLTPANLFLTTAGRYKVLDFGLAKLDPVVGAAFTDRTVTALSITGQIVGTLPYMSPEQARGETVDARSDLFALGLVLHEALTGKRVFGGSAAEVLSGILTVQPGAISGAVPGVPQEFDRILAKALEKDRDLRYQTAVELRTDLKRLQRDIEARTGSAAPPVKRRGLVALAVVLVAAIVLAAIALRTLRGGGGTQAPPLLNDATFTQVTDLPGLETFPALSPDGGTLIFASAHEGSWDIYAQRVGGTNLANLTSDSPADDTQPVYAPSGERIAFRSSRDGGGIFIMGATGESVRRLTDNGFNPTWSPDGRSLAFATELVEAPTSRMSYSAVWAVDVATGERRLVTDDNAVQPSWSPGGARIAYWKVDSSGNRDIYTVAAAGGEPVAVTNDAATDWSPAWSPDGTFLFFSSDRGGSMNLWRVAIDESTGQVSQSPEPVTTPAVNSGLLSFSRDGSRIAYVAQTTARNVVRVGFDAHKEHVIGTVQQVTRGTRYLRFPSVSPDGLRLAYTSDEKLMVSQIDGANARQLTDGVFRDRAPRWSPDGSTLYFYSNRTGTYEIWRIRPDGSALTQVTFGGTGVTFFYPVWSPDGRHLAFGDLKNRISYLFDPLKTWEQQQPVALPSLKEPRTVFAPWAWSSTEGLAGWALREDGQSAGITIFDPRTRAFNRLPGSGVRPQWLPDGKRLLIFEQNMLAITDTAGGASRPLRVSDVDEEFSLSPDSSVIYFMRSERAGDIWMISLHDRPQASP